MSDTEKTKAQAEQAKGKEALGRMTGNQRMTADGHADQAKGNARQAKEDVKDTFRHH
ncbi:CsbD family protein [Streptomyces erythrochromogenes]|uniref:CsbD family protein n=1 Tax=Streptomyces erythrochromogenes TaxID=285574 RepID=UPI0036CDBA12